MNNLNVTIFVCHTHEWYDDRIYTGAFLMLRLSSVSRVYIEHLSGWFIVAINKVLSEFTAISMACWCFPIWPCSAAKQKLLSDALSRIFNR